VVWGGGMRAFIDVVLLRGKLGVWICSSLLPALSFNTMVLPQYLRRAIGRQAGPQPNRVRKVD